MNLLVANTARTRTAFTLLSAALLVPTPAAGTGAAWASSAKASEERGARTVDAAKREAPRVDERPFHAVPASSPAAVDPAAPSTWARCEPGGAIEFANGLHAALKASGVDSVRIEIPLAGLGLHALELRRVRGVSDDAFVETGVSKRARRDELTDALRGVVHFAGSVAGVPDSSAYLAVGSTGVAAIVDLGAGQGAFTLRRIAGDAPGLCAGRCEFVRSSGTSAPDVPTCGGARSAGDGGVAAGGFGAVPPGGRRVVELAIDTDFDYFRIFDDSVAATEYLGVLVGAIANIYRRDCDATVVVSYIRLQQDRVDLFNESDPLGPFRDYWNQNGAEIDRDLFTLITGRRNLPYGGVAWLNAACGDFGYSVNGYIVGSFADPVVTNPGNWDINVVAHELGHNLGTLHTHDYGIDGCAAGTVQRGTIMSYCHVVQGASSNIDLRFHRGTAEQIEGFLVGAACLAADCDDDGQSDAEEILANPALDSNGDGLLDACQDCDANGVPDPIEIASGALVDADADGTPDSCEPDCDGNGVPDSQDIALDAALDTNGDFVLAGCETDCNGNGIADSDDMLADPSLDRSRDGRLDACEDCDGDGILDFAELRGSKSRWVASANDNLVRELDPRSGVVRRSVAVPAGPVNDLAIGSDGRLYIAAGNAVYAFSRVDGVAPVAFVANLPAEARAIATAPDGQLAVMLSTGRITLHGANGQSTSTFVAGFATDARDFVFRTVGSTTDAVVTRQAGIVRGFAWGGTSGSAIADLSALAPDLRGIYAMADGSLLVAARALNAVYRVAADGTYAEWDVDNGALVNGAYAIASAGDGRAVLVTGPSSSSTINGFNLATGYTERTYRVYPADAPAATAIVIAPASETDANGNLIPDECETRAADLNGDGVVDAADLAAILNAWGPCAGAACAADLDGSGLVDAADLAMLLGQWG